MKMFVFHLLTLVALVGCMPGKSSLEISMPKKGATVSSSVTSASISSVQVINNQLVINGNGFADVTNVKVNGNSLNENFSIETKTATKIIANSIRAFSFDVSKVFSLILSDANASATFAIDFSLCNATLNGKGFNCAAPVADKDVLAYDAVSGTWKPRPASGLNYLGTFDASSNPGAGPAIQPAGAYYVISDDGSIAAVSFAVGDWLVSNGTSWQKIDNSSAVLSVFGRYGAITAQQGDYTLDLMGDVSFPVAPVAGKVLKFDGTNWVAGDDLSGGGAGSVTTTAIAAGAVTDAKIDTVSASKITGTINSSQIADGTIVNADINAAAAIDYSKLNIPNTTIPYAKLNIANGDIPYAKLNIANGEIPAAKISGLPVVTSVLATTIADGDTTHAPDGNAVFDALGLKLDRAGDSITSGIFTFSGAAVLRAPDPIGATDVANKQYVDSYVQWTKSGADLYRLTGNVGIGTATPTQKLDVNGSAQLGVNSATSSSILLAPSVTAQGYLRLTSDPIANYIQSGLDGTVGSVKDLRFSPTLTATPWMAIQGTSGNVGIGTSIPSASLQTNKTSPTGTISSTATAITGVGTNFTLAFSVGDQIVTSGQAKTITAITDATNMTVSSSFASNLSPGTTYARVGAILNSGNVGIGTTSPQEKLVVSGNIQVSSGNLMIARAQTASRHLDLGQYSYIYSRNLNADSVNADSYGLVISNGSTMTDQATNTFTNPNSWFDPTKLEMRKGNFSFDWRASAGGVTETWNEAGWTNRFYINGSSGKIGVGSITPQTKLDVNGAIRIGVDATACSAAIAGAMRFTTPNVEFCNGTSWAALGSSGAAVASAQITDGTIVDADVNAAANITATKLGTGVVDNTEFNYLNGVTSSIQTQLNAKENSLATGGTTAQYFRGDKTLATLNTAGVPELTNLYFTQARAIASPLTGVTSTAGSITAADTILGAFGKLLNTQTDYVSKTANSTITGTMTINSIVGALKVPPPVNLDDAVPKSYVDDFGQWSKVGSDIYRSGGMVGLGTTTPDRRLTIIGDGSNYGDDIYIEAVNSETATPQISLTRSRGTTAARTPVLANDNLGTLAFRGNDVNGGAGSFPSASRIFGQAETDFATAVNGNLVFQTTSAGTLAEKMRITSKGMVGIGAATPTAKVSVGQSSVSSGAVTLTAASATNTFSTSAAITLNPGDLLVPTTTTAQTRAVLVGGAGTSFTVSPPFTAAVTGETFTIIPAGLNVYDKVYVQANSGFLGIGTPAPERALHILGTGGGDDDVFIASVGTTVNAGAISMVRARGTYGAEAPVLANDLLMDINARGYAGSIYEIVSNISVYSESDFATAPSGDMRFYTRASGAVRSEKLRITGAGTVGIGTGTATTSAAKLHVNTPANTPGVADELLRLSWSDSTDLTAGNGAKMTFYAPATNGGQADTETANIASYKENNIEGDTITALTFSTKNASTLSEKMRISSGGNVGIGTTTPVYHMDIQSQNSDAVVRTMAFTTTTNSGGTFIGSRARGTQAAPTHPLSGDLLAQFLGKNGVIGSSNPGMVIWAGENQSNTLQGDFMTFITTPNGTTTSTEKMRITGAGFVGIGTSAPDEKFVVFNGTTTGKYTATGWTHSSDARLKHDIHTITNATEKILKLRGVDYVLNNDPTNARQLGFIAQEVEPLFPEVVLTDKAGYKSMVYANLVAPLVEAFKDLYKKVTDIFMTTEKNTRAIASVNLKVKKLEEENAAKSKEIAELKAYLCAKDPRAPICK